MPGGTVKDLLSIIATSPKNTSGGSIVQLGQGCRSGIFHGVPKFLAARSYVPEDIPKFFEGGVFEVLGYHSTLISKEFLQLLGDFSSLSV